MLEDREDDSWTRWTVTITIPNTPPLIFILSLGIVLSAAVSKQNQRDRIHKSLLPLILLLQFNRLQMLAIPNKEASKICPVPGLMEPPPREIVDVSESL